MPYIKYLRVSALREDVVRHAALGGNPKHCHSYAHTSLAIEEFFLWIFVQLNTGERSNGPLCLYNNVLEI